LGKKKKTEETKERKMSKHVSKKIEDRKKTRIVDTKVKRLKILVRGIILLRKTLGLYFK